MVAKGWNQIVEEIAREGLPPRGWVRYVIRAGEGYEVSPPVAKGTLIPLGEGEEVVAELDGDLPVRTPCYPEFYGDSDLVEAYLLRVAPEKADEWLRLYGPATGWDPLAALKKVGVDAEGFLSSPEGGEFLRAAEAALIRALLEEVEA